MSAAPASGLVLALGGAIAYGLNIIYARMAAAVGISGTSIVFYRVLLILVLIGAVAALTRRSLAVAPSERGLLAVLGLSSTLVGVCYLSSVTFIPVTVAVAIFYTYPVLIVLANPLVEGRRLDAGSLGIVFCAFAGVFLVVGPAFQDLDPRGVLLAATASVATAVQFFAGARARRTSVPAKAFWINAMVLPVTVGIGALLGGLDGPADLALAPAAMTLGIAFFVVGFFLQFAALARASAVVTGLAFCAEPVVAALGSAILLGERLGPVQIAGSALVLASIIANVVLDHRRRSSGRISAAASIENAPT